MKTIKACNYDINKHPDWTDRDLINHADGMMANNIMNACDVLKPNVSDDGTQPYLMTESYPALNKDQSELCS